jgi:RNA polymerase sporulation-specific sigma factor
VANNEILFNEKYKDMSDESLISLIKAGDSHAQNFLLEKYSNLVNVKATKFFLVGGENDDIVQEGMIGLYKAIKAFDGEKDNSFKTFANLCIERQLITAIKMSNRQKHIPLNSSFSLNVSAFEENDDTSVLEVLDTKTVEDPLDTITKREYFTSVEDTLDKNLSKFEKDVLDLFVQGDSYIDIATKLKSTAKSVDNAIQRIRKKASKIIEDAE